MFLVFGRRSLLDQLLLLTYGLKDTENNNWAPHETTKGWADPFIGRLVMRFFDINAEITILNRVPEAMFMPKELEETVSILPKFY